MQSQVRFGELPDASESDGEGDWKPGEYLLKCCGGDRLWKKKVSLLVKASGNLGILTIHIYLLFITG
jgi:hypothetical protein